ncbi:DUF4192 domain-containing protein [Phytomonospora sp. NPDC050363]|uniref:DUF4192 domain-containing protein n=1 Tax=Phytomonospora sp. NPDC050363 TaxID=3155642 RepID=UPI0033D1E9CC
MTEPIPLRTGLEIVAAVPFLLRFHPADGDLVAIGIIDGHFQSANQVSAAGIHIDEVAERLAKDGCTSAHVIGYGPSQQVDDALNVAAIAFRYHDIDLQRVIQVTDGSYWSRHDPHDPDNGQRITTYSPVAAEMVARGMTALPDRDAITALLDSAPDDELRKVSIAIEAALKTGMHGPAAVALVRNHTDAGTFPDVTECAQILNSLRDRHGEALGFGITENDPKRALPVWLFVLRHAPDTHVGEPASQVAYAAFRSGHGALARDAIGLARVARPDSRLYDLIAMAINTTNPKKFPPMGSLLTALTDPATFTANTRPVNDGTPTPPSVNGATPEDPEPTHGHRHGR